MTNCTDTIVASRSVSAVSRADRLPRVTTRVITAFGRMMKWPFKQLLRWQAVELERHRLSNIGDHMLGDIGVTREELDRQMARPFWEHHR